MANLKSLTNKQLNRSQEVPIELANPHCQSESTNAVTVPRFLGIEPFARFGTWSDPIPMPYPHTTLQLVSWMARHQPGIRDEDALWEQCIISNRNCFQSLQPVNLCRPSWFIPAGETVFEVIKNPTNIPDNPPQGVILRHLEAMNVFGMRADYFFLRPTFVKDTGELFTGALARESAEEHKGRMISLTKTFGGALRKSDVARRLATRSFVSAKAAANRGLDKFRQVGVWMYEQSERRRIRIAAAEPSRLMVPTVRTLMERAIELGMIEEADAFRRSLRNFDTDELLVGIYTRQRAIGVEDFVDEAISFGVDMPRTDLRIAYRELQDIFHFDPILCFELRARPGILWLESHWFDGQDGKQYVHY
ncbi:MAG: hypothetical protein AAF497_29765 [Planctomycetota bacterium]